jgi:predicted HTH transcriptional regulator
MDAEKLTFLGSLVEYPEETTTAEYKSGIVFDSKNDFGAKLVKHIIGQANAGGGYIIIGFREGASGELAPDPSMNDDVSRSYETTRLSQAVDSFLASGQRIGLQVHKIESHSIVYPVISVQAFDDSPLFCRRDFKGQDEKLILKEGAIYIRDIAAKTVVIAGPGQFKALLRVAVERRQSEVLGHFRSLLAEMGLSLPTGIAAPPNVATEATFQEWLQEQRAAALRELAKTRD